MAAIRRRQPQQRATTDAASNCSKGGHLRPRDEHVGDLDAGHSDPNGRTRPHGRELLLGLPVAEQEHQEQDQWHAQHHPVDHEKSSTLKLVALQK